MSEYPEEKRNKICFVVTLPLTFRSFFILQMQYLSQHGFDVTAICSYDETIERELGDSVNYVPMKIPRGVSLFGSLASICMLKKHFKANRYDIIQYSTPNAAFCASIAAKQSRCKIRNYHQMGLRYLGDSGIKRAILKMLEKTTCKLSTSIECVSQSNLMLGSKEGLFPESKATVVWNGSTGGVDLERFDINKRENWRKQLRQEHGYNQNDFVFGFVGRITRDKGINELLESFFRLKDNSSLFIIGEYENDGTVDTALWNRAMNSPKVCIHSPSKEIERYYALIDVLVLPSYREGFGNVVIEAAAMGTPSIISNIPGPIDAVIINKTGVVTEPKSVEDLVSAMKEVQKINVIEMGNAAKEHVKNSFCSKSLCKKILERKLSLIRDSSEKERVF